MVFSTVAQTITILGEYKKLTVSPPFVTFDGSFDQANQTVQQKWEEEERSFCRYQVASEDVGCHCQERPIQIKTMITQMTDDADIKMMKDDADDDIDVDDRYWLTITIRGI